MMSQGFVPLWGLAFRVVVPWVWRGPHIAKKLMGFSATEAGSARDMFLAAEAVDDPKLRNLFLRHALDEARHAEMFAAAARRLSTSARAPAYEETHALPQNLFASMTLLEFLAFVERAERHGQRQFQALSTTLHDPALQDLFARVERDEQFHIAYAKAELERRAVVDGVSARRIRRRVALREAWRTWRAMGRKLGDKVARLVLGMAYVVGALLVAVFAKREDHAGRWHPSMTAPKTLQDMRRQS